MNLFLHLTLKEAEKVETESCELQDVNFRYPRLAGVNKSLYPAGKLEELRQRYQEDKVIHMCPFIKTETTNDGWGQLSKLLHGLSCIREKLLLNFRNNTADEGLINQT